MCRFSKWVKVYLKSRAPQVTHSLEARYLFIALKVVLGAIVVIEMDKLAKVGI